MKPFRLLAVAALGMLVSACASNPQDPDANDPLEPVNREVFRFNHGLDDQVAIPVATFYRSATPEPFRLHLHYFLANLHGPITFANDVLQGHFERGGEAIGRFAVNSTLGFVGIFDVATDWGMPYHSEDFGQTMGYYGMPEGPYLVIPFGGPTVTRDLAGTYVDHFLDPLAYVHWRYQSYWSWTRTALSFVDTRSRSIDDLKEIQRSSIDLYATTRSLYRQSRNIEIRNGEPDVEGLPDF
ncbi:MAG: VacJ family lipoprotein [Alphaproteobacteria bacterium]|nr:VacJ family lipoprotein [Alphaproteobacteria bacterium]MBL6938427.1 VacJ family lipoprotein [Alphaproteobacteria bacterium]MBL7096486.1 VacJ family lipoprotein [Alphaproteobacteria bacterium]